eukprot:CAMPEP_0172194018 /NCGR_PEP_ID=MMETSP1050-20130122/25319_1 /TAXON_ID=233186 /ORGANISM="Cryptomonas curvata, Strain CCAP979/52" /LENGTH=76 /DNA_ID=CAMNT_0012869723 /DNA_START=313 /DNA_END=540 /DNA_ORIENTATION=+
MAYIIHEIGYCGIALGSSNAFDQQLQMSTAAAECIDSNGYQKRSLRADMTDNSNYGGWVSRQLSSGHVRIALSTDR